MPTTSKRFLERSRDSLQSIWPFVRNRVVRRLAESGPDGITELLRAAGRGNRGARSAERWLDQNGYGPERWRELLSNEVEALSWYASRRIVQARERSPRVLAESYIQLASMFIAQKAPGGGSALRYADLLSAYASASEAVLSHLLPHLSSTDVVIRRAVYKALSQSKKFGAKLLWDHALEERDPHAFAEVTTALSRCAADLRPQLLSAAGSDNARLKGIALGLMTHAPNQFADQLAFAFSFLRSTDDELSQRATQLINAIAGQFSAAHRRMTFRGQVFVTPRKTELSADAVKLFGAGVAAACKNAAQSADAALDLLSSRSRETRNAALFVLDIVSLGLSAEKRTEIRQALEFATLGEQDAGAQERIREMLRRFDNGEGLSFLRMAA